MGKKELNLGRQESSHRKRRSHCIGGHTQRDGLGWRRSDSVQASWHRHGDGLSLLLPSSRLSKAQAPTGLQVRWAQECSSPKLMAPKLRLQDTCQQPSEAGEQPLPLEACAPLSQSKTPGEPRVSLTDRCPPLPPSYRATRTPPEDGQEPGASGCLWEDEEDGEETGERDSNVLCSWVPFNVSCVSPSIH